MVDGMTLHDQSAACASPTLYHPLRHISRPEAARKLGLSVATLRRWERRGILPAIRFSPALVAYERDIFAQFVAVLGGDGSKSAERNL
jgi:transcriptional regulator with XRE-family HTH domain